MAKFDGSVVRKGATGGTTHTMKAPMSQRRSLNAKPPDIEKETPADETEPVERVKDQEEGAEPPAFEE
jgi:hypothetical protein